MRPTWVLLLLTLVLSGRSLGQSPYAPSQYEPSQYQPRQYEPSQTAPSPYTPSVYEPSRYTSPLPAPPADPAYGEPQLGQVDWTVPPPWADSPAEEVINDVTLTEVPPVADKRPKRAAGSGGPFGGSGGPGYGVEWFPVQPVKGQDVDFQLVSQKASAGLPVYRGDLGMAVLTVGVENMHTFTDAVLPDTGRAFPEDLWNIKFGLTYIRQFESGSTLGIITSVGSASDQPFHSVDEINLNLISFLRRPARNERDAWMFGVMYSPSGSLNFPVPIIAYEWNKSETFQMNLGIPLSMTWRPRENWTLKAAYVPLTNGSVMLTYDLSDDWHAYGGYRSLADSYFLSDRVNKEDRFFAIQQRLVTGIRWDVGDHGALDLSAGYAFDRRYGEGENQGSTLHDEIEVEPGAFLGLDFRLVF
ncbi:DUF6268 family outer membrane beta-barrel protein [Bremerella alba]|uniref:DUF6268 domain-containing protein n=1 Tax=Bremerella alba TaxID=980252 RepID=A0A7V9A915_9BACT|nr:DUF6268 family outer membrane beta-barrel protein [Bremerella alba]MBA2116873.1 hypothetical protein [Bremerella alba]